MVGADGTVYVGSDDRNLYAIDTTGNLRWKSKATGTFRSSPVVGADGTVYVGSGSDNNFLIAFESTGKARWKFQIFQNRTVRSSTKSEIN